MSDPADTDTLTDQPISQLGTPDFSDPRRSSAPAIDRLTGTTAENRAAFFEDAKGRLNDAVTSAVAAVKENPKAAAAIAAGATVAVAGAAYGATRLAKTNGSRAPAKTRTPSRRKAPAKK